MLSRVVVVCECLHQKRAHVITKLQPAGPCSECDCSAFRPEKQCDIPKCGHGKKAHRKGRCRECGCTTFRPKP